MKSPSRTSKSQTKPSSPSPHVFHVAERAPEDSLSGGSRTRVDARDFPILKGMALYRLVLEAGGVREPHWHPNAHELGYCLGGLALVTIFTHGSYRETFTISGGEMFFVPSGYLHHIENTGAGRAEFVLVFSSELPEDFGISGAMGCMSDAVLGNTWGLPAAYFSKLRRSPRDTVIGRRARPAAIPPEARRPSRFKFSVEENQPGISTPFGFAKLARSSTWPALEGLSMFSLLLKDVGMREPHWHPRTAELGYVVHGRARMTILSPGAQVDTYTLEPGDMYFIPKAYAHHIENLTPGEEVRILVFFDQASGEDIGFSGAVRAYSDEVLGATFNCAPEFFARIPETDADKLIVRTKNPTR